MKKEGYGPGKDITNTLLSRDSYMKANTEKMKKIINKMDLSKNKDTYTYAKKIVNGKIGGIPVDELPDNYNKNQINNKNFDNVELYNSLSKHNKFKLNQQINKKEP